MSHLTVGQAAERLAADGLVVRPRDVTALFYDRRLDPARTTLVGGRRLIPVEMLPEIREALANRSRSRNQAVSA